MPTETKVSSNLTELAASCRMVAGFWLNEVDQQTLALLRTPHVREAWIGSGGLMPDDGSISAETLNRLAADYCQLLIGPKEHLPPVQSVWSDHVFQSKAAASSRRFYQLYADYQRPRSIDDHLGCQLHFAGFLLDQVNHDETAIEVLAAFEREHLGWAEPLLDRVTQKADTDFYRGLAVVTGRLIKELSCHAEHSPNNK